MDKTKRIPTNTAVTASGITVAGSCSDTAGAVSEKYSNACLPLGSPQATLTLYYVFEYSRKPMGGLCGHDRTLGVAKIGRGQGIWVEIRLY